MARLLLVLVLVGVVFWWLASRSRVRAAPRSRPAAEPEAFIRCAHCGVHLPRADAVIEQDLGYCSEAHRLAGPKDRGAP
jgi:uncharacterized protein